MSMVNTLGVQVVARKRTRVDVELAKDVAVIGYRAQGISFRQIGKIMGVSHVAVLKRWHNIKPEARSYYAKLAVG